nr:Crp/Fnr family transcriptional regulator [Sphingomonas sp. CROZ-RG-20F-R02-07]
MVRRGQILLREHDPVTELFVLKSGMMMSYVLLHDGSRQILRFLFPGDLLALSALPYRQSPETLTALTDCTVCPFERAAFTRVLGEHPRLATAVIVLNQIERVALTDRLAGLGRTSAKARIAALLLEIRDRLARTNRAIGKTFVLGLTQEEIGDATGLTSVHVNRMLRELEDEGLIARDGGRVTLLDERTLARAAHYADRTTKRDFGWLAADT